MRIEVEIPGQFGLMANQEEWRQNLKLYTALMLFRQHLISLGSAFELAGVDIYSFMKYCGQYVIPVIDYEAGELEAEVQSLMQDLK